ncbi:hypothetical protein E2C01_004797 [Portunus trituberculatus]|uniref:Uncharacterized protein n=1 Tax=Portunus trituberculatus TaxID=210409 RepID=A0A5B7CRH5_PORTR|nr:hypothetical protein [Portunus trituberculatus]
MEESRSKAQYHSHWARARSRAPAPFPRQAGGSCVRDLGEHICGTLITTFTGHDTLGITGEEAARRRHWYTLLPSYRPSSANDYDDYVIYIIKDWDNNLKTMFQLGIGNLAVCLSGRRPHESTRAEGASQDEAPYGRPSQRAFLLSVH